MAKKKDARLCPGEWIVEVKVLRRIRVCAPDEIQAEKEAAKELSAADRASATDVRIAAGRYEDGRHYVVRTDEWYTPGAGYSGAGGA